MTTMTAEDIKYFRACFDQGLVHSPLLEIGSRKNLGETHTFRDVARDLGVASTLGTDLNVGPGVDVATDFSVPTPAFRDQWQHGTFQTVVIFNVLEHTFDPITVLTNALHCVAPGGMLLTLTPSVWPIHSFPKDYTRLLPDWFETFAERNGLELDPRTFSWVSEFGIHPVQQLRDDTGLTLPSFHQLASPMKSFHSRVIHRLFNTFGRSHQFTYCTLGAGFRKPGTA